MKITFLTSVHTVWDTRIYHREAKSLVQAGYQVTIIATEIPSQKTAENIDIIGLKRPKWRVGRALNWISFIKAALKTKPDLYHFHDPDLLFVGLFLQWFTKKPVIYDNHDPYVEAILQREWLPIQFRPIVSWVFNFIEKFVAKKLAAVIIANDSQQNRFPYATLIGNYPDLKPFNRLFQKNIKKNSIRIIHVGDLTEARGVYELVEIAKRLAHKRIPLCVLGPFANKGLEAEIKQAVCQHHLQDLLKFEGRVPYEHVIRSLMKASIGLITFRAVPHHLMIVPTKLFEYMACALPVVAGDLTPIRRYVAETGCGILVSPEDPQAFVEAIEYLLSHPVEARIMGQNGRRAVLERFNWKTEEQKLLTLYQNLLQSC